MPAFAGMTAGGLRVSVFPRLFQIVIPAKAGIQRLQSHASMKPRIPAFAEMTAGGFRWNGCGRQALAKSAAASPSSRAITHSR